MSRSAQFTKSLQKLPIRDRVELARKRLEDTMRLVHELICLAEQRRSFVTTAVSYDIDWKANHAYETLFVTIVYFEVVHICRIWDTAESEGYGIPTLAVIVDHPDVLRSIEAALAQDRGPAIAAVNLQKLRRALGDVRLVEECDTLERLRNHRHKHAAHAIFRTDPEVSGKVIARPNLLQDAEELIEKTMEIMAAACSLVAPAYEDFGKIRRRERETAERFFAVVGPALAEAAKRI